MQTAPELLRLSSSRKTWYFSLIMLFDGLQWGIWGRARTCRARIDRSFSFYGLSFAYTGRLSRVDHRGRVLEVLAPTVWLTVPDYHYRYGAIEGESWDQTYVTFGGEQAELWRRAGLLEVGDDGLRIVPTARPEWWRVQLDALLQDLAAGAARHDCAAHRVQGLLMHLFEERDLVVHGETSTRRRVRDWLASLANLERLSTDVEAEAARLGMSAATLRRTCVELCGAPPREVLAQHRATRAAILLRSTDLPIAAIARDLNYVDQAHLGRDFRRRFNVSPGLYRRSASLSASSHVDAPAVLRRTTSSG